MAATLLADDSEVALLSAALVVLVRLRIVPVFGPESSARLRLLVGLGELLPCSGPFGGDVTKAFIPAGDKIVHGVRVGFGCILEQHTADARDTFPEVKCLDAMSRGGARGGGGRGV